jgi:hypothetical protein
VSTPSADDLDRLLARRRELLARDATRTSSESRLDDLRRWQAARLARTYADLHENPRYAQAVDFFLSDLYGAHDFSAREREITRAWRYLKRSLPEAPLRALGRAIELDVLTVELDHAMAAALPAGPLNDAAYAQAYRTVGQRAERERQIELVVRAGGDLDRAVQHAWMGVVLKAAHGPAHAAGFGVLQDFIERGYRAFKAMGTAREFLAIVRERETTLMEALFAGARK